MCCDIIDPASDGWGQWGALDGKGRGRIGLRGEKTHDYCLHLWKVLLYSEREV